MRFTTEKPAEEMTMLELAHNCCYIGPDKNARYRNYCEDWDAREFVKALLYKFTGKKYNICDSDFDELILEFMQHGTEDMYGVFAIMYNLIWSMAELRERLKKYEDGGKK